MEGWKERGNEESKEGRYEISKKESEEKEEKKKRKIAREYIRKKG